MIDIINFWILSSGLPILFLCLGAYYYFVWSKSTQISRFKDPTYCDKILQCLHKDDATWKRSAKESVKARALPNKRLIETFGIDNAFTTLDDSRRKLFRRQAATKLNLAYGNWKGFADIAQELVSKSLQPGANSSEIPLVPLVQSLALKIAIYTLFKLDSLRLNDKTVSTLARQINTLWLESKQMPLNNLSVEILKKELEESLGEIFPNQSLEPEEKPMNLILPAYETIWRVVFRCFLEVAFRNPATAPAWHRALVRFFQNPTKDQFEHESDKDPDSVLFIVYEALRLYPPTKRVFRKFPKELGWGEKTVAADIEECQRDPRTWGARSLEFVPSRWRDLSDTIEKSFMPFGGELFICPAKKEFGPWMIGLLVAALAQGISKDEWALNNDDFSDGQRPFRPLDPSRNAYLSLSISKK